MMQRTWTDIGRHEVLDTTLEGGTRITRRTVEAAIDELDWKVPPKRLPALPGMGIKACIKELRIPKVSQIAISSELAPFGFYGIEGNYTNGRARIYIIDLGTHLVPLASELLEPEAVDA